MYQQSAQVVQILPSHMAQVVERVRAFVIAIAIVLLFAICCRYCLLRYLLSLTVAN